MGKIGIIAGSGFYNLENVQIVDELKVATPFGSPSDAVIKCLYNNLEVYFIARHGKGHKYLPSEVNYRANIFALKKLGVTKCIGFSAVGSLKKEFAPGEFVIPDQLIDKTYGRNTTFFSSPYVGHVAFGNPFCNNLRDVVFSVMSKKTKVHSGGTYVCMQGPHFSTKAESNLHREIGASLIGMTAATEAKLAREAQISYASICMVTDYDCWKEDNEVTVVNVLSVLKNNTKIAKEALPDILDRVSKTNASVYCRTSLKTAIICDLAKIDDDQKEIHAVLSS